MNLKTKKIIAREFLILIICIGIGFLTFLAIYPYNFLKRKSIERLEQEITSKRVLSDNISKSYTEKRKNQFWFTEGHVKKFNTSRDENYTNAKLWGIIYKIAKSDSTKYKWDKKWSKELITFLNEIGFKTSDSFQSFILSNMIYKEDIEKNKKASIINSEIEDIQIKVNDTSKKILSLENQLRSAGLASIIALAVFFFMRYFFYSVRWSVRTLKQAKE